MSSFMFLSYFNLSFLLPGRSTSWSVLYCRTFRGVFGEFGGHGAIPRDDIRTATCWETFGKPLR